MNSLCLTFVNSKWYKKNHVFKDPIELNSWWEDISQEYDLPISTVPDENERLILVTLRDFLANLLEEITAGREISEQASAEINELLSLNSVNYQLKKIEGDYQLQVVSHSNEMNQLTHMIVLSFLELSVMGDRRRLKNCSNPDCGWYFYDESKNSSRKWCDGTCRSLMKVRAFRKRHKVDHAIADMNI